MNCIESNPKITFIYNILIHMCILFTILSIIYFFYIKDISTRHYNNQLNNMTKDNLIDIYQNMDSNSKEYLRQVFQSEYTDRIEVYIKDRPSIIEQHNLWVQRICFSIVIVLILILIGIYFVFRHMGICIPIRQLLIENIVTFIFIGIFEVLFFLKVVLKYAPVKPSSMNQTIVFTLRDELTKK